MRKLFWLILGLVVSGVLAESDAPYLYYEFHDGYLIERADGSDSHILGEGLTVESRQGDANWSASGEWLAWRGVDVGGCGASSEPRDSLYVAGIDQNRRFPFQSVTYRWSPADEHIILVAEDETGILWQLLDPVEVLAGGTLPEVARVGWVGDTAVIYYGKTALLIAPDLTVTEITLPAEMFDLSPQGDAIFIRNRQLVAHNLLTQTERSHKTTTTKLESVLWYGDEAIIHTGTGWFYLSSTQLKPLPDEPLSWQWLRAGVALAKSEETAAIYDFTNDTQQPITIPISRYDLPDAALSPDMHQFAYIEDGPVLIDVNTQTTLRVSPIAESYGGNPGGFVRWHPSQNWLIAEEEGIAGCGSSWYTQVTNGAQRYEIPVCGISCVFWLPQQVHPDLFPVYDKPHQPEPVKTFHATDWVSQLDWSGDASVLQAGLGQYSPSTFVAWDVNTGESASTFTVIDPVYEFQEWYESTNFLGESENFVVLLHGMYDKRTQAKLEIEHNDYGTFGFTHHITPDERFMIAGGSGEKLRIWSLPDGKLIYEGMHVTACTVSPDGKYVAVGLGWDVAIYEIVTLLDG